MTSPTFTERRLYRNAALLQAFQTAQGTPVDDFTTAATKKMWLRRLILDPGYAKEDFQGSTGTSKKRKEGRFLLEKKPLGSILGGATPANIEWLLRSWGGTWAGTPTKTFTFVETINEFATLALVESSPVPNTQKLVRFSDMWAYRVKLVQASGVSTLDVEADFAGRTFRRDILNALPGGVVLPSSFGPAAIDVFAPHQFRLFRDPAGANVSIAVRELSIEFTGGLLHETWNDELPQVINEGHNTIKVIFRGIWKDETYAIQDDAETLTPTFKRFSAEWTSGAKNFKIDMRNVDFIPSPTGWESGMFREFNVEGEAYLDDGTGTYIDITLTP